MTYLTLKQRKKNFKTYKMVASFIPEPDSLLSKPIQASINTKVITRTDIKEIRRRKKLIKSL